MTSRPRRDFSPNPRCRSGHYDPLWAGILSRAGERAARAAMHAWPGRAPTPLVALDRLAAQLSLAGIDYKDEGSRFGLGSFKALGGAYAVYRIVTDRIRARTGLDATAAALLRGVHADLAGAITVTCATDGNHGRSVAWGAHLFGCGCVIFVHPGVSPGRIKAIERFGARVVVAPGNYDDAVRRADSEAAREGWVVVSDTSYPGYVDIPRHVMQGYAVMVEEALQQAAAAGRPATHVFVQGGVGGLAAAVIAHINESLGPAAPRIVVVEPERAACLLASAVAGQPTAVTGALDTVMAGLACGEVSSLAWPIIDSGAWAFMTVPDEMAVAAMRLLASGDAGATIVAGESGVAGLAGLMSASSDDGLRDSIGLAPDSRILLFGTEGATDAEVYRRLVGHPPIDQARH